MDTKSKLLVPKKQKKKNRASSGVNQFWKGWVFRILDEKKKYKT